MTKQQRNIRERWVTFNIYDYSKEKYKKKKKSTRTHKAISFKF